MRSATLFITALAFALLALPNPPAHSEPQDQTPPLRVTVMAELPATLPSFDDAALVAVLYEYDPFLADAAAREIDRVVVRHLGHQQGVDQTLRFTIADKIKALRSGTKHYLSCRIYEDLGQEKFKQGKELHYCHNEHDSLPGTVYDEVNGQALTFTAQ